MKNARLENLFKLTGKVEIYVPATVNINEEIDNTEYVDKVLSVLSDCFGGATSTQALGAWRSGNVLIKERTTLVYAHCGESDLNKNIDKVIDLCEELKKKMTQEAIAMTINGEMYFI